MSAKAVVLSIAAVAVVLCGLIATRMGSEFVPQLNEGDLAIQALRIPGTSLSQSIAMQRQIEGTLKEKFPEIDRVFARTGTAEIASDPMPPNISDGYIMLKPMDGLLKNMRGVAGPTLLGDGRVLIVLDVQELFE